MGSRPRGSHRDINIPFDFPTADFSHPEAPSGIFPVLMMRRPRKALLLACLAISLPFQALAAPPGAAAKYSGLSFSRSTTPEGETLTMTAPQITTWEAPDATSPSGLVSIVQLGETGSTTGVEIMIDRTRLTAQSAVIWISKAVGSPVDAQAVRVSLLGDARVEQDGVVRSGTNLFVTATVRGTIRLNTASRIARDASDGDTFKVAENLRTVAEVPTERMGPAVFSRPAGEPERRRDVESVDLRRSPVRFSFESAQTVPTADGKMAILLTGKVVIFQSSEKGDFLEFRAQRAVLFVNAKSIAEADTIRESSTDREDMIQAVYLEGDVRMTVNPKRSNAIGEQRLEANRVYYDFPTNRAFLTDAVLHTVDPRRQLPLIMRARTMQQVSEGQYDAQHVEVSTSSFAIPTYSMRASTVYVRRFEDEGAPRTHFQGENITFDALGLPFFYLPYAAGDAENFPLRALGFESGDRYGFGVRTTWGLYELLGEPHPKGLDAQFHVDYFTDRGPATGLDLNYHGGLVTETTAEPWNFEGHLQSYIIDDNGYDTFAGNRTNVTPDQAARGQVLFEHQHFLPDDWQVQIRAGYASDATFLEEFFQNDFDTQLPYELSFYAKRQRESEQLSVLATVSPNNFPTTADQVSEQVSVQRFPEIGYHRIGESALDDRFTFFSDNVASLLDFKPSGPSLARQGYPTLGANSTVNALTPGIPSYAQTGTNDTTVGRADARQELDYPLQAGQFKIVPYVLARYTGYTDSAAGGSQQRIYGAVGERFTTAFWRVDDTVDSELFDIHRVRHVVEPVVNLYASGSTVDASKLYIYDSAIDEANPINAAQFRLEQRWQTQRGGPGRWRSVDFLTLNVEANAFTSGPDPSTFLNPQGFRGEYFDSLPEASIPRDSINADGSWRVSDNFIVLADEQYNIDERHLATAAAGLSIQRDQRLSYYIEQRYVDAGAYPYPAGGIAPTPLTNITSFGATYELSTKYSLQFTQSYDFAQDNNVSNSISIIRKFDRLIAIVTAYEDSINGQTGLKFVLLPEGLNSNASNRFFNALQTPKSQSH